MLSWLQTLRNEWPTLKQAPWSFVVIAALFLIIGMAAGGVIRSTRALIADVAPRTGVARPQPALEASAPAQGASGNVRRDEDPKEADLDRQIQGVGFESKPGSSPGSQRRAKSAPDRAASSSEPSVLVGDVSSSDQSGGVTAGYVGTVDQ